LPRVVAPAPFDATPDGPTCVRPSCQLISRGLAAFHATSSTSTARSGWLPRSTTTRTSPCSAAWNRGSGGGQVLGCPSLMTILSEPTCPMRWCAHGITQTACGDDAMWRAPNGVAALNDVHDQIAVEQSAHAVTPTVCAHSSVRCGSEPWSVERAPRDVVRPCASEPFVKRFCRGWKCNHLSDPKPLLVSSCGSGLFIICRPKMALNGVGQPGGGAGV
jgi:hypothetical protein